VNLQPQGGHREPISYREALSARVARQHIECHVRAGGSAEDFDYQHLLAEGELAEFWYQWYEDMA
jgi:hypothetical protein